MFLFQTRLLTLILISLFQTSLSQIESFSYAESGANWPDECSIGKEQSPVNINTRTCVPCNEQDTSFSLAVTFNETNQTTETENLGVTFKVFGNWSTLHWTFNESEYFFDCLQFHFHAPSEHTINGDYYDGEMHMVHELRQEPNSTVNLTRKYAVLGILLMVNESAGPNPFFEIYNPLTTGEITLNATSLEQILTPGNFYFYEGGLTTPGCGEVVNWFVVDSPMMVTQSQIDAFQNAWAKNISFAGGRGNNRNVMPLNGREILAGTIGAEVLKVVLLGIWLFFIALLNL